MVLATHGDRGEKRGQVMMFTAIILALIMVSAVIVINGSYRSANDISQGVEKEELQPMQVVEDSERIAQRAVVKSNRKSVSINTTFNQSKNAMKKNAQYNGLIIDMEKTKNIDGTRIWGRFDPNNPSHNESEFVTGLDRDSVGAVAIDLERSSIKNESSPFNISYGSNTVEVYNQSGEIQVDLDGGDGSWNNSISQPGERLVVDLGVGKVNGFAMSGYDTDAAGAVNVSNSDTTGNEVYWSAEFVSRGNSGTNSGEQMNEEPNSMYGIVYNVEVQSQRTQIRTSRLATHAPRPDRAL